MCVTLTNSCLLYNFEAWNMCLDFCQYLPIYPLRFRCLIKNYIQNQSKLHKVKTTDAKLYITANIIKTMHKLTFIVSKAQITFPPSCINKRYKWIDVCSAWTTANNNAWLNHRQLLNQKQFRSHEINTNKCLWHHVLPVDSHNDLLHLVSIQNLVAVWYFSQIF